MPESSSSDKVPSDKPLLAKGRSSPVETWKKDFRDAVRREKILKQPDWSEILQALLCNKADDNNCAITTTKQKGKAPARSTLSAAITKTTSSSSLCPSSSSSASSTASKRTHVTSDSSKSDSCLLTEEAKKGFEDAFKSMENSHKWGYDYRHNDQLPTSSKIKDFI
ncbi:hypothetical protein BDB00DRAFT_879993 [Zychaea mexicana]|uniref:uncharacterized protein n=1 Tax=Zychaea mexicana TaxID=64656 RepID=UPI0022FF3334|nr:uncharacterized protein BDB00DRAFT_879993 [Zychaea mexicana]KAI9471406.1 hypothetical protein BDB00DRAFT_879993 [Zychaea mexicana]